MMHLEQTRHGRMQVRHSGRATVVAEGFRKSEIGSFMLCYDRLQYVYLLFEISCIFLWRSSVDCDKTSGYVVNILCHGLSTVEFISVWLCCFVFVFCVLFFCFCC